MLGVIKKESIFKADLEPQNSLSNWGWRKSGNPTIIRPSQNKGIALRE